MEVDSTPVSQAAVAAVQALKSGDVALAAAAAVHICVLSAHDTPPPALLEGVRAITVSKRTTAERAAKEQLQLPARAADAGGPAPQVPALVNLLQTTSPALQARRPCLRPKRARPSLRGRQQSCGRALP